MRRLSSRIQQSLGVGFVLLAMVGSVWAAAGDLAGLHNLIPANAAPLAWQYDGDQGPLHWGEIAPTTASCEKGTHQSPITQQAAI